MNHHVISIFFEIILHNLGKLTENASDFEK